MRAVSHILNPVLHTYSELFGLELTSIQYGTLSWPKSFDERFDLKGHDLFFFLISWHIAHSSMLVYKHELLGEEGIKGLNGNGKNAMKITFFKKVWISSKKNTEN